MENVKKTVTDKLPSIFRLAKEASRFSDHPKHHLSAILFINKKAVRIGYNSMKTHPRIGRINPLKRTHAEIDALSGFKKNWEKANDKFMVVFREDRNGNLACSRPCNACQQVLKEYGIKKVFYTTIGGICEERWL